MMRLGDERRGVGCGAQVLSYLPDELSSFWHRPCAALLESYEPPARGLYVKFWPRSYAAI